MKQSFRITFGYVQLQCFSKNIQGEISLFKSNCSNEYRLSRLFVYTSLAGMRGKRSKMEEVQEE